MSYESFWSTNTGPGQHQMKRFEIDRTDPKFAVFVMRSGLGAKLISCIKQTGTNLQLETTNFYTAKGGGIRMAANEQPETSDNDRQLRHVYRFNIDDSVEPPVVRGYGDRYGDPVPVSKPDLESLRQEIAASTERLGDQ
jgi:hypothetical protein